MVREREVVRKGEWYRKSRRRPACGEEVVKESKKGEKEEHAPSKRKKKDYRSSKLLPYTRYLRLTSPRLSYDVHALAKARSNLNVRSRQSTSEAGRIDGKEKRRGWKRRGKERVVQTPMLRWRF